MSIYNNNKCSLKEREQHYIQRLAIRYPNLEYVKGYKGSESIVTLKCKICGDIFTRNANCIRHRKPITCLNCRHNSITIRKLLNKQATYLNDIKRKQNKEIKDIYVKLKESTIYIQECSKCGKEYIEHSKSKYCTKCRQKTRKKHSYKSLKTLYERDNGYCHLCGGKCNWNDKKEINGTIIVGETYPSIDHITPISKGGTDDWNNLKLAHFKCNWVKGA